MRKEASVFLAVFCMIALPVFSADIKLTGMTRTNLTVATETGDFLLAEQTLQTAMDGYGKKSGFHVSPAVSVSVDGEPRFAVREAYVDLLTGFADVRIGKQAVVWGKAEGFFITDVVSPQDLSNFILADFSEIRIGIPAVRTQKYLGKISLDVVWIPFFVPTVFPEPGSPWHTAEMGAFTTYDAQMGNLSDSEFFGKLAYFGSGFDAELMAGYARDDQPVLEGNAPLLQTRYQRITVIGGSVGKPIGPVLARAEAVVYLDRAFTTRPSPTEFESSRKAEIVGLVGLDWNLGGIDFSAQYSGRYISDYAETLVLPEYRQTASVRARDSYLGDALVAEFFAYVGLDPYDALLRPSVSYTIEDGVILKAEADIFLGDSSGQYGRYRDNTLFSTSISWYF